MGVGIRRGIDVKRYQSMLRYTQISLLPDHQRQDRGTQIIQDLIAVADWLILPIEMPILIENPPSISAIA